MVVGSWLVAEILTSLGIEIPVTAMVLVPTDTVPGLNCVPTITCIRDNRRLAMNDLRGPCEASNEYHYMTSHRGMSVMTCLTHPHNSLPFLVVSNFLLICFNTPRTGGNPLEATAIAHILTENVWNVNYFTPHCYQYVFLDLCHRHGDCIHYLLDDVA